AWGALYSRASVRQPAAPETCPLSLHDALPIFAGVHRRVVKIELCHASLCRSIRPWKSPATSKTTEKTQRMQHLRVPVAEPTRCRSEEHTSELQSRENLVCRLLLEKKKQKHSPD